MDERYTYGYNLGWNEPNEYINSLNGIMTSYNDQMSKIDEITTNVNDAIEIARYDIHGRLLSEPSKGINIIKYSDGSTRKEIVK